MDLEPHIIKAAPGIVGSAIAMLRMPAIGIWQRLTAFAGGVACSHWGTEVVVSLVPVMSERASAFVLGLFGMSLIGKAFQLIDEIKPIELVKDILAARKSSPPAPPPKP